MKSEFNKIAIIGPGLIGSSLGLALKKKKIAKTILGIDKSESNLKEALNNKSIDISSKIIDKNLNDCEIIFICTPVSKIEELVNKVIPFVNKKTILTDVGSVKNIFSKSNLQKINAACKLVPGHPIAGTEFSGAKNAFYNLFKNKWCILTPHNKNVSEVKIISNIWRLIGMKVSIMSADEHDKLMSVTSHLPHLIAFTIVGTAFNISEKKKKDLLNFSAGGFKDFTRIGSSDPQMWSDIFLKNKKHLLNTLNDFNQDLDTLKKFILEMDEQSIIKLLTKTKEIRQQILKVERNFDH